MVAYVRVVDCFACDHNYSCTFSVFLYTVNKTNYKMICLCYKHAPYMHTLSSHAYCEKYCERYVSVWMIGASNCLFSFQLCLFVCSSLYFELDKNKQELETTSVKVSYCRSSFYIVSSFVEFFKMNKTTVCISVPLLLDISALGTPTYHTHHTHIPHTTPTYHTHTHMLLCCFFLIRL